MKDPYVYQGSRVLINKLNIKDEEQLNKVESDILALAIVKIKKSNFKINDIFSYLTIHKLLFDEIYSWAGKIRTINIYKGEEILDGKSIDYVYASYLNSALNELNDEFIKVEWDNMPVKEKITKICYFVSEVWHIHPFREGNTRTAAMFLYFLIKKANLHININFLLRNGLYFRNALALSCLYNMARPELLFGIVADSVSYKNVSSAKYETINGKEIEKYSYTNHTMKKIKTITKPKKRIKK